MIKLVLFCRLGFVTQSDMLISSFVPQPHRLKNNGVLYIHLFLTATYLQN